MSENDEPGAKTRRRKKRRRSLRVPVDEVPRPTQSADAAVPQDGGATVEMPAFDPGAADSDQPRVTLRDVKRSALADDEEPIDDEALEPIDDDRPAVSEDLTVSAELEIDDGLGATHSGELEAGELESGELEMDVADAPLAAEPTVIQGPPSEPVIAGAAEPTPPPVESETPSLEVVLDEAEAREPESVAVDAPPPAAPAPIVGVVVQRVVAIVSGPPSQSSSSFESDTQPGTELAVDVDDEPELRVAEPEGADLDDLDVDLDEGEAQARPPRDSAPELLAEEAEELLEEADDVATDGDDAKRPSKPPPPPAKAKDAPPPPPEAPAAEPAKATPARRKKPRRQWWEELFNDDYLRTVPIPHPRIIERQCDFIEQRLGLAQGATVLDVGCGLGLHAVELTRRGYLVVGLDLSLPMLSRAADEAQDHGFKINFLHADMREMNFDGAFDAVICYGTTFGYFDDETNKQVVERLFRALKPRGLLLLDVVNRDFVIRNQPNLVWFEGDGCVVMEESQMNYITSRLEVKRTVILDDGRQRDNVYSLRTYSLHELGQILHQQRFRVVEVTGWEAHPGVFFGGDSPKLIILAERRPSGPPTPPARTASGELASEPAPPPSAEPGEPAEGAPEPRSTLPDGAEPSDAVTEALAEALESSGELQLESDAPDELDAEELSEDELDDETPDDDDAPERE